MKILLLGVGMQGKAALQDLVQNVAVSQVIAADRDLPLLQAHVAKKDYGERVECVHLDAADAAQLDQLMGRGPDVVIDLLPAPFIGTVAAAAVKNGRHLINTMYTTPELTALAAQARANNVTILPEFGLDPGLDLVLLGEAVRQFDQIEKIRSYGAGIPEAEAAANPLQYKVTWTFDGVLRSYMRPSVELRDGQVREIAAAETFAAENVHEVDLEGVGKLEAYPNGDGITYADLLGIDKLALRQAGRYTMRWPGHCAFWKKLVDLHLLDDEPALVDGTAVDRKAFLAAVIEPHIRLGDDERDLAIVRIEVEGRKDGRRRRAAYQVIDRRDLQTGLTAMSRTVGYTASIGALMIGSGVVDGRGLLSPVRDVPYDYLVQELRQRGVEVTAENEEIATNSKRVDPDERGWNG